MKFNKKWASIAIPIFFLAIVIFTTTFIFLNSLINIPKEAELLFGPPAENLRGFQRYLIAKNLMDNQDKLTTPHSSSNSVIELAIEPELTAQEILTYLLEKELISETDTLLNYLIYTGGDTKLRSGTYFIPPSLPPILIIEEIKRPSVFEIQINVFQGMRVEEIAQQIETYGIATKAEFFNALDNVPTNQFDWSITPPVNNHHEGFLATGSYQYLPGTSVQLLANEIIQSFDSYVSKDIIDGISEQGLSVYQAVTLASIIERESLIAGENPIIASVFLNRLTIDMKLESDATVQYGIGFNTSQSLWWTNPLFLSDLAFDSPYNTYLYHNLPPGPISSISKEALRAVAFPAHTNFFFFQAKCDGSGEHNFSVTFEEHLNNICN